MTENENYPYNCSDDGYIHELDSNGNCIYCATNDKDCE